MEGSFGEEALRGYKCFGNRPWMKDKDPIPCNATLRTMQRGATNLHFSATFSALSIPPWSKNMQLKISEQWRDISTFIDDRDIFERFVTGRGWPKNLGCTATEMWEQAIIIKNKREA
jgi:hypothetical protein